MILIMVTCLLLLIPFIFIMELVNFLSLILNKEKKRKEKILISTNRLIRVGQRLSAAESLVSSL